MAVSYAGSSDWTLQAGSGAETSPEGLVTVTEIWKGRTSTRPAFITSKPRGVASVMTAYTSLTSISAPRFTEDGAYSTAYIVFQGAPSSSGTNESDLDVNYSSESRTVELVTSADASTNTFKVAFVAPTVTASYVALSKPGAFRFASLVNSEPDPDIEEAIVTAVGSTTARELVEGTDYVLKTESKWTERRNVGGIWHMSEQHAKLIANKVYE